MPTLQKVNVTEKSEDLDQILPIDEGEWFYAEVLKKSPPPQKKIDHIHGSHSWSLATPTMASLGVLSIEALVRTVHLSFRLKFKFVWLQFLTVIHALNVRNGFVLKIQYRTLNITFVIINTVVSFILVRSHFHRSRLIVCRFFLVLAVKGEIIVETGSDLREKPVSEDVVHITQTDRFSRGALRLFQQTVLVSIYSVSHHL